MPVNRAPFNALVDDDGTNTIGTPWNKAAIKGVVLDPVDASAAFINQGNTFTGNQEIRKDAPQLIQHDTSGVANARRVSAFTYGGAFFIQMLDDAGAYQVNALELTRTGDAKIGRDVYEKGRPTPMGHWVDFTPSIGGGGTMTITTLHAARYIVIGKTMTISLYASVTMLYGATFQSLTLPGGAVGVGLSANPMLYAGTAQGTGLAQTQAGVATLRFYRDLTTVTTWQDGAYTLGTTATFAIQ
jgi:hypothetical protein